MHITFCYHIFLVTGTTFGEHVKNSHFPAKQAKTNPITKIVFLPSLQFIQFVSLTLQMAEL